ncbi:hypothetical protein FE810_09450 [Thalassotalea litorea]|uniref:Uncharacterized protein n=1 Tax=Thalassotalea litorea TaxID=2020715 RepID=A0A5R9IT91_9GAMM|nr:hypothetical protein [Thalassotalea litorea]TLU65138.1 hypothetical protein FE810_09450 [Thalassotalea litorea]
MKTPLVPSVTTFIIAALATGLFMSHATQAKTNAPSDTIATSGAIATYTVNYVDKVDTISQTTQHALQYLDYQGQLEIYNQARQTIADIGKQTRQINNQIAQTGAGENWTDSDNAAK